MCSRLKVLFQHHLTSSLRQWSLLKGHGNIVKSSISPPWAFILFITLCVLGLVSLCTLTLLSYERYNVVCKPKAGLKLSMRRSAIGLLFVWIFCLFWAVTPLFGWSSYGPEGVQTSCSLAWEERSWSNYSYLILYTLLCFIFPVTVIIYCYSKVLKSMNKVESAMAPAYLLHIYAISTRFKIHTTILFCLQFTTYRLKQVISF